jgi:hypothetical protein
MARRALIFTVPKGREVHYSKIQGPIIGSVWAPLYHSYGYYMPANTSRDPDGENTSLKFYSKLGLTNSFVTVLSCAVFGVKPLIRAGVGGILWSEFESAFATWDGHVTFGSSQLGSHAIGFYVWSAIRELLKGKYSTGRLLLLLGLSVFSIPGFYEMVSAWAGDGFDPVSPLVRTEFEMKTNYGYEDNGGFHIHRVDHVAHIGGILTGFLNASLQLG